MEKKEGVQGGPRILAKGGGDSEDVWGEFMEVEDEAESRKKLDEQKKKPRKALREVDRLCFASQEVQENLKESLQHQLQEVEKRRHDLMPEHQRVQKKSQKTQSIQDKRKICRKTAWRQEKKFGKSKNNLIGKKNDSLCCRTKVIKTGWQDADMVAELQSLQAGEERRGSNASQTGDGCLEALWQQLIAWRANGILAFAQKLQREMGAAQGQMPRREEGRRTGEDEQEQGRISQQLVLSAPGGINEGAPASSLELDLHRVRSAPGEGGGAGKSGAQGDRKRGPSRSPGHPSMEEDDELGNVVQ